MSFVREPGVGTRVERGGRERVPGLQPGDIVTRAAATSAPTPAELRALLARASTSGFLTLVVRREGRQQVIAARVAGGSDAPTRFDTLLRAALFINAVVLAAPALSGFADAAAVALLRGEPYWRVWQTRLFSNTLTALAIVPVLAAVTRLRGATGRRFSWRRALEMGALLALLAVVGTVVSGGV